MKLNKLKKYYTDDEDILIWRTTKEIQNMSKILINRGLSYEELMLLRAKVGKAIDNLIIKINSSGIRQ